MVVVVPTYNEAENIVGLIDALLAASPGGRVVVVDDSSPDGTAAKVREAIERLGDKADPQVHLLVRKVKDGRGSAVIEGLKWALTRWPDAQRFAEMDADFSHRPDELPRLSEEMDHSGAPVAVGSRYMPGSRIEGWPLRRRLFSKAVNLSLRATVDWGWSDLSNGFRIYSREAAQTLVAHSYRTKGYIVLSEQAMILKSAGFRACFVPIHFVNRVRGASNLDHRELLNAARGLASLWKAKLAPLKSTPLWAALRQLNKLRQELVQKHHEWKEIALARLPRPRVALSPDPFYQRWLDRQASDRGAVTSRGSRPSFELLVWAGPEATAETLARTLASSRRQNLDGFELSLAGHLPDGLPFGPTRRVARGVDRAQTMNEAAAGSRADYLVFAEAGDVLAADALRVLASTDLADFAYSDEDRLHREGDPPSFDHPFFKPGWSPDILLSADYTGALKAVRRELFESVGGMRSGFEGAEEHDLLLRLLPRLKTVRHVERVLYHRASPWPIEREAATRAVREHLRRTYGPSFDLAPGSTGAPEALAFEGEPTISVIIPFRDKPALLRELTDSIFARTRYRHFELVLVSNASQQPDTFALLDELKASHSNVRVLDYDRPFNWSAINNFAARQCSSELLLFLNNDMKVATERWLSALVAHAARPDVCVTGAKLLYPDQAIQHYGVIVGITGFAGHVFAGNPPEGWSYYGPTHWIRNFLAVTGACLMVRRDLFERLGGFDESFILCGSDVELCLRAQRVSGKRVVCTPHAVLLHYESKSRGTEIPANDFAASLKHYEPFLRDGDPYYNRNLSLRATQPRIRLHAEDALAMARATVEKLNTHA